MAGAAPQHRAGSNATTTGMIVAIIVAVALLGVLIWMFTMQEKLREDADLAKRTQTRLATIGDENVARQILGEITGTQKTVLGETIAGLQLLSGRMTGNQNTAPKSAVKDLEEALTEIKAKVPDADGVSGALGAVKIIRNLHAMFLSEQEAKEKAETTLAKANEDLEALRKANEDLDKTFKGDLTKMSAKVDELQKAKDEFDRIKGDEIKALVAQIGEKRDTLDTMRKDQATLVDKARREIAKRDQSIEEQSKALSDLRGQGTAQAAEPLAIARKPVGKVLRALPGDALVHIDLGKQDNVGLGMTFSVYSEDERVPADGHGKATLEVASLGERTAECKIVTPPPPDDPILPGDFVGNIVLQRHKAKKTHICVVGQFDVDFDGRVDARGSETIRALAERYGAELVDTVDANTDYVVVGVLPEGIDEKLPTAPPSTGAKTKEATADKKKKETKEAAEGEEKEDEDKSGDEAEKGDESGGDKKEADDSEEEEEADSGDEEAEAEDEGDKADAEDEGDKADADAEEVKDPTAEDQDNAESKEKPSVAELPRLVKESELDPTAGPSGRRAKTELEKYDEAIRRAEMFAIPRLRQDQFLSFVGIEIGPDAIKRLSR